MRKTIVALALGLLVSFAAVTNSNSQEENWEQEDAHIRLCQEFGRAIAPLVEQSEADKTAGVNEQTEIERTTERVKDLGSSAVSEPPKDAKAYADLIVGTVWFPNTTDIAHEAYASVVGFCNM